MSLLKLSFDDLLREVLERARQTLGGDTAVILLRRLHEADEEDDGTVLYARAAIGLDEETRERVGVPIGCGFAGRVAAEQRPVILDEVDYNQVVSPYIREKRLRSLVGVPLLTEAGLLGVLHVGSVKPGKFGQKDVEILMAALGGAAIGAATGGLTGALVGYGIPELEAKQYEGKVKGGNILLSVHTNDGDQVSRVKEIFKRNNAEDIAYTGESSVPRSESAARA